jgi:hypothetical protein
MEQTKIGRPPASVSRLHRPTRRVRKRRLVGIDRLAHQIVNQLTVVNLTCFKLRAAIKDIPQSMDADVERLESAVAEMNSLVELLNRLQEQTNPSERSKPMANSTGVPSNVYPLSDAKKGGG